MRRFLIILKHCESLISLGFWLWWLKWGILADWRWVALQVKLPYFIGSFESVFDRRTYYRKRNLLIPFTILISSLENNPSFEPMITMIAWEAALIANGEWRRIHAHKFKRRPIVNQAVRDVYLRVAISIHKIHEVFHASSSSFDAQKMCDRNRRNPSYSLLSSKQSLDISDFL